MPQRAVQLRGGSLTVADQIRRPNDQIRRFGETRSMATRSILLIVSGLWMALACASVSPSNFDADAPKLAVSWPGPVSVTAVKRENPESRFNTGNAVFKVNLDEFSEQLSDLVSESLEKSGTPIGGGGKHMQIEVVYLDFMFQGPCYVDYTVTLGNGEVFGQQASGASRLFDTACAKALESAVGMIIGEARTLRYLGGQ